MKKELEAEYISKDELKGRLIHALDIVAEQKKALEQIAELCHEAMHGARIVRPFAAYRVVKYVCSKHPVVRVHKLMEIEKEKSESVVSLASVLTPMFQNPRAFPSRIRIREESGKVSLHLEVIEP